jgi:glycosyltransferase involved in cell wall biosynthesis
LPAKYGGWETLVDNLTQRLSSRFHLTVYCSKKKYTEHIDQLNGSRLIYINLDANGVQSIIYDFISMLLSSRYADTMLILGVSGCVFLPVIKLLYKGKIIVNIDGLEWKRDKWNMLAKWFLKKSESVAVSFADVIIADNRAIQDYILKEYNSKSVFIAYGGDHVEHIAEKTNVLKNYGLDECSYAFKVCRIEPENNISLILHSFEKYFGMDLVIVGNWNNSQYGISIKDNYKKYSHIHLLDAIYDQGVLNQLRSGCSVYIHGHSAGGTNPSLVEAMCLGLPIVAFGCDFNRETTFNQAIYFNSQHELSQILSQLDDCAIDNLGKTMGNLANEMYTWNKISNAYADLF